MNSKREITRRQAIKGIGLSLAAGELLAAGEAGAAPKIDRHAVVSRHDVRLTAPDLNRPLQVGNGEFAFGMDITGLQTFAAFNTMSQWGWHHFPPPHGKKPDEFKGAEWDTHGRQIRYPAPSAEQPELGSWLYNNPDRLNLGRIGLALKKADGSIASITDVSEIEQWLSLWTGIVISRFRFDGEAVEVVTCCHPTIDLVAFSIRSRLIGSGGLAVELNFPYADHNEFANFVGDFGHPETHQTEVKRSDNRADFKRTVDDAVYHVSLAWSGGGSLSGDGKEHRFALSAHSGDMLEFVCGFGQNPLPGKLPNAREVQKQSEVGWSKFWNSGAAIDLSESSDPRWRELERRVVLSQYLLAVNEAGSLPPQESGLVNNGWHGKFHMEMYWWHATHYALWNRWPILKRSIGIYDRFHASSKKRAASEGVRGARWPKMTSPEGWESTHPCNALLIWQQPHPMFFAELDYRAHPTRETLEKWKEIVFDTADFLASFAFYDEPTKRYVLGPPIYVVSENTDPKITQNPTYELSQWRFGLRIAAQWRQRLGMPVNEEWDRVRTGLAALPQQDGLYVLYEGVKEMWTKMNFEHPALTGIYGMLPGDAVDVETMRRTHKKVLEVWNLNATWGWDFPMLAMCAAKLGETSTAINLLLHPSTGFQFDERGLCTGGPFPYFPANGGLLYAIGLMAGGWDGSGDKSTPGFPETWRVKAEGFARAL